VKTGIKRGSLGARILLAGLMFFVKGNLTQRRKGAKTQVFLICFLKEKIFSRPAFRAFAALFFLGAQLVPTIVLANPTDGQVVAGGATIDQAGSSLTVNQSTDKVIINWQDFSIGAGELTKFIQPSATSAALNRVVGDNLSSIYGTLQSNGQVYLINPNGIVVGASGVINTGGFVASTQNVANGEFLNGSALNFKGSSDAAITNLGSISASGGDIFLIANKIENQGTLTANGIVGFGAGQDVLLTEGQDRLMVRPNLSAPGAIKNVGLIQGTQMELKAAGGNVYALAIKNEGTIRATGSETVNGRVLLKADGSIKNSGTIAARNADGSGGTIEMAGGVSLLSPSTVEVGGTLDVSAISASETALIENLKGGSITITGQQVKVESDAQLLANGASGGGTVLIGGDYQGANPDVQNAEKTYVSSGARIEANALVQGHGGKVIVWADQWTKYFGSLEARGAGLGGNGGLAEVSGKQSLDFDGLVNLSAPNGQAGKLLLDPTDVTIQTGGATNLTPLGGDPNIFSPFGIPGATPGVVTVSSLLSALGSADVEIRTNNVSGTGAGNITIANDILYTGGANRILKFSAEGSVTLNSGVSISSSNAQLEIRLSANTDLAAGGDIVLGSGSLINSNGAAIFFSASGFTIGSTASITGAAINFIAANTGPVNLLLGSTSGGLALSQAELDTVNGLIWIQNPTGGNVVIAGNVVINPLNSSKLFVVASDGNFDDLVTNSLSVNDLDVNLGTSGQMLMGGANHDVNSLKAIGTSQIDFKDTDDISLNTMSSSGNIRLTSNGGIDASGAIIIASAIALEGLGNFDFSGSNSVVTWAADVSGNLTIGNTSGIDLTIGTVAGVNGLRSTGQNISVKNSSASVFINQKIDSKLDTTITAGADLIFSGGGTLRAMDAILTSFGDLVVGPSFVEGTLSLTQNAAAADSITQSGAINVTTLTASTLGSIQLANVGNKIEFLSNVTASSGSINISEDPGVTVSGPIFAAGNITIGSNEGDLKLVTTIVSGAGTITLYTNFGNNVDIMAGSLSGLNYVVYSTTQDFLGNLMFDTTINSALFPAPGILAGENTLVLITASADAPNLDNVDTQPRINDPGQDDVITDEDGEGNLQGAGIILTAYGVEEGDFIDNEDGFVGLDNFGNTTQIRDPLIIAKLREALGDKAWNDLLSALGLTEEEYGSDGGVPITVGETFDMSNLSSGTLDNAPQALKDALSDKAKAELEAILAGILEDTGTLDGVTVTIGQVVDMQGNPIPNMPSVLVVALGPAAKRELENALK